MSLMIALLAAPLALMARGYACAPQECAMACCRGHHIMPMQCNHESGAMQCAMDCHSQAPDYGLAAPLAPTRLSAAVTLQKPPMRPANFVPVILNFTNGYFLPPFEPPRG